MRKYIGIEFRKALRSKEFLIALFVGLGIVLINNWDTANHMKNVIYEYNKMLKGRVDDFSCYNVYGLWIGNDYVTLGTTAFFYLLPFLGLLAYSWSLCQERTCGYDRNVITRTSRKVYYLSKYIATFITGGLVITIPLIFNFWLTTFYTNFAEPDVIANFYCMSHGSMFSELFYTHPFLFSLLYVGIDFVLAGVIACCGMVLGFYIKKRVTILIIPMIALLIIDYGKYQIQKIVHTEFEISPIRFLHHTPLMSKANGWIILAWFTGLLLLSIGICVKRGRREDVY